MRQRLLFEGELSDVALENVFPTLISKAVETDNDVFLRWNGATIRVKPTDTIDTLIQNLLCKQPPQGRAKDSNENSE